MKTQRLTTYFFGHKVEVTLALSEEHDKPYVSVPRSVMDNFSERIECGQRHGTFENLPDDKQNTDGVGFFLSGSWRIVEIDYEKISRVLAWDYNFAPDEALTEELFIRYFGGYPEGVSYAILIMNVCVWFIDQVCKPSRFGMTKELKEKQKAAKKAAKEGSAT